MHDRPEEEPAAGPLVQVVELLVAAAGAEEERGDRVLGAEKEDDGELRESDKAWMKGETVNRTSRERRTGAVGV